MCASTPKIPKPPPPLPPPAPSATSLEEPEARKKKPLSGGILQSLRLPLNATGFQGGSSVG